MQGRKVTNLLYWSIISRTFLYGFWEIGSLLSGEPLPKWGEKWSICMWENGLVLGAQVGVRGWPVLLFCFIPFVCKHVRQLYISFRSLSAKLVM